MHRKKLTTVLAAAAATALLLAGCAGEDEPGSEEATTTAAPAEQDAEAEFNEADVEYAAGMIVHHEQAVEMSDILLAKEDVVPEVAALAQDVQAAQGPEIEQMEAWLDGWGHEPDDHGGHSHEDHAAMGHDGMMSEDDLAALEAADGPEASRLFLEQMIVHHEGAVTMAEEHLEAGEDPDALELSQSVVADQSAEIELMREMLGGL